MTTFDNHPPVNFSAASTVASASRDGGCYNGIGYNDYDLFQGRKFHLVHSYSSGCEYNNRVDRTKEHLGVFEDRETVITFLLSEPEDVPQWARNELLTDLQYMGEEA
jgi:hypothetical protein